MGRGREKGPLARGQRWPAEQQGLLAAPASNGQSLSTRSPPGRRRCRDRKEPGGTAQPAPPARPARQCRWHPGSRPRPWHAVLVCGWLLQEPPGQRQQTDARRRPWRQPERAGRQAGGARGSPQSRWQLPGRRKLGPGLALRAGLHRLHVRSAEGSAQWLSVWEYGSMAQSCELRDLISATSACLLKEYAVQQRGDGSALLAGRRRADVDAQPLRLCRRRC